MLTRVFECAAGPAISGGLVEWLGFPGCALGGGRAPTRPHHLRVRASRTPAAAAPAPRSLARRMLRLIGVICLLYAPLIAFLRNPPAIKRDSTDVRTRLRACACACARVMSLAYTNTYKYS